ncbi:hypothetical protein ACKFKG_30455 [Phormidesmis sp. 146-35]
MGLPYGRLYWIVLSDQKSPQTTIDPVDRRLGTLRNLNETL